MPKTFPVTRSLGLAAAAVFLPLGPAAAQPIPGMSEGQTVLAIAGVLVLIFSAIGGYMIYSGIASRRIAKASESWPATGGTVLASEVEERSSYNRKNRTTTYYFTPKIRYSYKIAGTNYESSVIRFGDLVRNSRGLPDELVAKYPAGSTVAIRYDPGDPGRATLETVSAGGRQILTGAVFIGVPLFIAAVALAIFQFAGAGPDLPPEVLEQLNKPN